MRNQMTRDLVLVMGVIAAVAVWAGPVARVEQATPPEPPAGDWPTYRHDHAGTGYSTLTAVNAGNVAALKQAWTYSLAAEAPAPAGRGGAQAANSQATPIVVRGVMYLPAADRVVALDAETGRERWRTPIAGGAPSRRGLSYWPGDEKVEARLFVTAGRRLIALNAATGRAETSFGTNGEVDMVVPYNSVPLVYRHIVVVGANTPPGTPGGIGNPRAYDARTGAKLWEFNAVPQPGEVGHDTWGGDSWRNRLGVNAWPFYFTVDERRGLLYVPLASPIGGAYGGDRPGDNLFGNSVVAVEIETGKYRWHFQTIHHDLWDADPPAPPSLFDITRDGRTIPALGLTTKSGYLYILNRETGQPVFGVEERAVPKSEVPGEAAAATQPFPVKPPPLARVDYKPEDVVTAADTSAEHASACEALIQKNGGVFNAGPFTPWLFRAEGAAPRSTLVFPGGLGGANWGGTAVDPRAGLIFVGTQDVGALGWVERARAGSPFEYEKGALDRTFDVPMSGSRWPCQKPPWGRLTAVNVATGEIAWQIPLGITEALPAEKQRTGRPLLAGPIVTAGGLLFIAATDDNRFRALDVKTGAELWVAPLPRRGNADPVTYQSIGGRQYVAVVAGDTLVAFALP
jgi:quinoprotein glucose dehydrogenase